MHGVAVGNVLQSSQLQKHMSTQAAPHLLMALTSRK
jgi:hypothetical protein